MFMARFNEMVNNVARRRHALDSCEGSPLVSYNIILRMFINVSIRRYYETGFNHNLKKNNRGKIVFFAKTYVI